MPRRSCSADDARHQEKPQILRQLRTEGEIAREQPHHQRAGNILEEGMKRKARAEPAHGQDVDHVTQHRSDAAADKQKKINHSPASLSSRMMETTM